MESPKKEGAMKATQLTRVGGPEVMEIADLPVPQPKPNEVVCELKISHVVANIASRTLASDPTVPAWDL